MADNLTKVLIHKAVISCESCYLFSHTRNLDERDRYNEHAMNALQTIINNSSKEVTYESIVCREALSECEDCEYKSSKIADILRKNELI